MRRVKQCCHGPNSYESSSLQEFCVELLRAEIVLKSVFGTYQTHLGKVTRYRCRCQRQLV